MGGGHIVEHPLGQYQSIGSHHHDIRLRVGNRSDLKPANVLLKSRQNAKQKRKLSVKLLRRKPQKIKLSQQHQRLNQLKKQKHQLKRIKPVVKLKLLS